MIGKTDTRKCGTCEYWTGKREPIFDKNGKPKIHIDDDTGSCEKYDSRFHEQSRRQELSCKYYSKWTELF